MDLDSSVVDDGVVANISFVSFVGVLFQEYVNTCLKIKQEASGWPKWAGDDET